MARINDVFLIGNVVNDELEPKIVGKSQTDGEKANVVLNFLMKTYDDEIQRFINVTVAIWGEEMVGQCMTNLKKDDLVCIKGELRYKFIYNHQTKQTERIYTNVKASSIEFLTKKMKTQELDCYENTVRLLGNLANDPIETEEGFVVAIDRLYPTKEATAPNSELTDFVTLVLHDKSILKGDITKGKSVYIDGKLMTRKKRLDIIEPRIVVKVNKMVGA